MGELSGKKIVVTGGVTGIGGAASRAPGRGWGQVLAQYWSGGDGTRRRSQKRGIATLKLDLTARGRRAH